MQLVGIFLPLLILTSAVSADVRADAAISPITRVVDLLTGVASRVELDGKAEEILYEKFVCWATSIIRQKTATNAAAQSRVDELKTYIEDLQAGRIDLTTERVDLQKQIKTLTDDMEIALQMRSKEAADYEVAQNEMQQAMSALSDAIDVLRTATQNHTRGVLLRLNGGLDLSAGNSERAKEALALNQAVKLGERALNKGDALFLRRLLTGEVPQRASWKDLNRKATFKMDYKARSFKIQDVLSKLLQNFVSDLEAATTKERGAINLFNQLTRAKGAEKDALTTALGKLDGEKGARTLSLSESNAEKSSLSTQISNDNIYIAQVRAALAEKKTNWKARQSLRVDELAAISRAIALLRADDARDLFKRSGASQGYLFFQEASKQARRRQGAVKVLRRVARASQDARLAAVATAATTGEFDEVISAIDTMLGTLETEETADLHKKERCESDRSVDTRDAIKTSRGMDELSENIMRLQSKINELTPEKEAKESRVADINTNLVEILAVHTKEHEEFLATKKDDEDAASIVASSKQVLQQFYQENGLMLQQELSHGRQPFKTQAGEAPPPPPKTWEGTYGGKTEEMHGILAIMDMIRDDILNDLAKAEDEDRDALALYTKTTNSLEDEKHTLAGAIVDLNLAISGASASISTDKRSRSTSMGALSLLLGKIKDAEPSCDFISINFGLRSSNRQTEKDGLEKAKAILSGGRFDGLPDPKRELKPGDAASALVQRPMHGKFLSRNVK